MSNNNDLILLAMEDLPTLHLLERALRGSNFDVALASSKDRLDAILMETSPSLLLVSQTLQGVDGLKLATEVLDRFPTLPVVLFADRDDPVIYKKAMRAGLRDVVAPPVQVDQIVNSIKESKKRAELMGDWVRREVRRTTASLEKRVSEMESLVRLGKNIHGSLALDDVLSNVVTSAVQLTGANEGLLMLVDELGQNLVLRAIWDGSSEKARIASESIKDELALEVIMGGKPVNYSADSPGGRKANADTFALIYAPIFTRGQVAGVLGVINKQNKRPFTPHNELFIAVLADYAAISIRNAQLFEATEKERAKLDAALTNVQDGVILIDQESRIMLINPVARRAFGLGMKNLIGVPISEAITDHSFNEQIESIRGNPLKHHELSFEDGRVFNLQYTPINGVGAVIAIEDITHLKMLDRLKSDFIHTISHDLRSPLTAIMGYVELLDRVGPLNDQQKTFVNHVQNSVNNITGLVNDLLDLGRIEAGYDQHQDLVTLQTIVHHTVDNLQQQAIEKSITITCNLTEPLPNVRGNPIRLRQVVDNLLVNAIKYTTEGGQVTVDMKSEEDHLIIKISDTGVGIPLPDQAHIFEKFYRASNAPRGVQGTGLGLAIVKSIVESHGGRIWLESAVGQGTTFFILLPAEKPE